MYAAKLSAALCFLLPLLILSDAYIPRMFRGRPKGGFVGSPGMGHLNLAERWSAVSQVPPDQWFDQKLDHFNPADTRRWQQRYFTSRDASQSDVIFVMIGGEGTASPLWNVVGSWVEYAKKYNAVCLQLEHRFYGKSHPTPDTALENIRYLSSEQALFDLAAFISAKKQQYSAKKVVVFGGSYPGSLAAWIRLKFPHLIDGAVSTSAPLLAQVNFKGYLEVVRDSLNTFSPAESCNQAIKTAVFAIGEALSNANTTKDFEKNFRLCDSVSLDKPDLDNLYSTLAGNFEGVVQYNKDNRAFEGAVGTNITIDTLCSIMTDSSVGSELDRYAKVNDLMLKTYSEKCTDYKYKNMIDSLRDVSWKSEAAEGGRQWTYQTCTEFGFYQSSDSPNQPFGQKFPIDFWTQQCVDIFGPHFNASFISRAVEQTNINYGARDYTEDRIVFVNGGIDPWHYLGITKSLPQAPAIYIPDTAHCANMYPATKNDSKALVQARVTIDKLIGTWLQ